MKNIKYGKMPVRKYLISNHYHIIIGIEEGKFISVGLTSDKPNDKKNQKLHKVYESNGKIARLKRNITIDIIVKYKKKNANFNVDIDTEKKVIDMAKKRENKKSKSDT